MALPQSQIRTKSAGCLLMIRTPIWVGRFHLKPPDLETAEELPIERKGMSKVAVWSCQGRFHIFLEMTYGRALVKELTELARLV
jgi:hypothetical protein